MFINLSLAEKCSSIFCQYHIWVLKHQYALGGVVLLSFPCSKQLSFAHQYKWQSSALFTCASIPSIETHKTWVQTWYVQFRGFSWCRTAQPNQHRRFTNISLYAICSGVSKNSSAGLEEREIYSTSKPSAKLMLWSYLHIRNRQSKQTLACIVRCTSTIILYINI